MWRMNRSLKHTLLALMFAITPIGVLAEEYEMGDLVTIPIEMPITSIIVTPDVYCTEPNAPPVCLTVVKEYAQVSPEPEVTQEP